VVADGRGDGAVKRRFRRLPFAGKLAVISAGFFVLGLLLGRDGTMLAAYAVVGLVAALLLWLAGRAWRGMRNRPRGRSRGKQAQPAQRLAPRVPAAAAVAPAAWDRPAAWASATRPDLAHAAPGIGDVLALTPGQFEDLAAALLSRLGYAQMQRVGGAGDLGADLVGRDPQGRSTIVQCKRYAPGATIGTPVVQTFIGMLTVHHRAERGVIVSTAGYTQPAIDLARRHGIALVDGEALLLLLHLTGTGPAALAAR
jgi:restriction system protein